MAAEDPAGLQRELSTKLKDRSFILRNFYTNSKLTYDLNGELQSKPDPPSWRLAGIHVENVELKHEGLKLEGKRVITTTGSKDVGPESFLSNDKIEIHVDFAHTSPDESTIAHALNQIFLTNSDNVADLEQRADQQSSQAWKVGVGVSAPRAVYSPDPEYTGAARRQKLQGIVVLWLVIGEDGTVHDVRIARRLGLGLDEEAVRAVKTWRFLPAIRNGTPVPVQVNIEVNFRLYN